MTMDARIRERLSVLAPVAVTLRDDSAAHAGHAGAADGGHFTLAIVSAHFEGLPRLGRHRLVYRALGTLMQQGIHALALSTLTPAEAASQPTPASGNPKETR